MFFEWMGIIFVGVLAIFFPRTILAIVSWNVLEYQAETGIILVILTIAAAICDFYEIYKEKN